MKNMLLIIFIITALLSGDQCMSQELAAKLKQAIGNDIYRYPTGYLDIIKDLYSSGSLRQGTISTSELSSAGSRYGLHSHFARLIIDMQFADIGVLSSFSVYDYTYKSNRLKQIIGGAILFPNGKVEFAQIETNTGGSIIQKQTIYNVRICKKFLFWKKCHNEQRTAPRGPNYFESNVILQTLKARSFETLNSYIDRNIRANSNDVENIEEPNFLG